MTNEQVREQIAEIILEVRQYLCNTEFAPKPFNQPADSNILRIKFPNQILTLLQPLIDQACVEKRVGAFKVVGYFLDENWIKLELNTLDLKIIRVWQTIVDELKSGRMPAAATKIGFERIKGMPLFYGRGKDSLKQKPIIRSSGPEVKE